MYKRDPISLIDGLDNPMVSGLSYIWQYVNEVKQIPTVLHLLIDAYEKQYPKQKQQTLPPHLAEVVELGKEVDELLAKLRAPKSPGGPPSEIDLKTLMVALGELSAKIPPWTPFKGQHVPGLISAV